MRNIERMLLELNANFNGDAWHGTPLRLLLDGIDEAKARAHSIRGAHSIAELVSHLTAWTHIVQRRLAGEAVEVTTDMDYPDVDSVPWPAIIERLEEAHTAVIDTLARTPEAQLDAIVAGKDYTVDHMMHGLVSHYAYHGGQIALLRKT